jgi:membrane fusion protein, multidrug efflux system
MKGLQLLAAGLLLLAAGCSNEKSSAAQQKPALPAVPVTVAEVVSKTVPVQLRVIGNVEAYTVVSVKPQINGEIFRVHITPGQEVRRGDLLFAIDPRPFEASLRQAEANVARDRAALTQAKASLSEKRAAQKQAEANLVRDQAQLENAQVQTRRYAELVRKEFVAKEQYDQIRTNERALEATAQADQAAVEDAKAGVIAAEAAVSNAEAVIRSAQAAVENARLQLAYCSIRSPIEGRAGDLLVHAGNVVKANPDNPLLVINQVHPIYVNFAVPEQNLEAIKKFRAAGSLRVEAIIPQASGARQEGSLTFVNNTVDMTTGTIQLKGTFANRDNALWPGQFVDVVLTLTDEPDALVLPSQAIQAGQKGSFVFVVKPDLTVESRPVTVGRALEQRETVITRGVKPGERVVTDGQARLLPGAKVIIRTVAPAPKEG